MKEIVKVWAQGQAKSSCIVIPREMARKLGIEIGDFVEIVLEGKELRLRKVE
jgi:bifunctional DNA-binding transcriptional regulator/antitoxin component of YhaV-PrlF toxin-antitoxin module